jgi:transcriptional regulator with GAF, ATPase, and Fis domain
MLGAEHLPQPDASVSPAVSTVATQAASIRVGSDGVHVELPAEGIAFDDIERAVLQAALAQADGNVSGAARLLQLNRDAMRYRIRKLDIDE